MTSVDPCYADLGLAAVPCSDKVRTPLHKATERTLARCI